MSRPLGNVQADALDHARQLLSSTVISFAKSDLQFYVRPQESRHWCFEGVPTREQCSLERRPCHNLHRGRVRIKSALRWAYTRVLRLVSLTTTRSRICTTASSSRTVVAVSAGALSSVKLALLRAVSSLLLVAVTVVVVVVGGGGAEECR